MPIYQVVTSGVDLTKEQRDTLANTDLPPDQIVVAVTDTPPSWLMEAGMVLPETNHEAEAAWMKNLQERYPGKYDDYE
jgi:hypothetical protein